MKLLFVVQAYGEEISGGAESHCRMFATRLAQRGHDVHVLTSCATDYITWENVYATGTSQVEGVTVHRLSVDKPRNIEQFGPFSGRVLTGYRPVPLFMQENWIDRQGPHLPQLTEWLWSNAPSYDSVIFFTYLYYPTVRGLPVVSGRVRTVLHPLAHDEAPFYLDVYDPLFTLADQLAFSVEEEAELTVRRSRTSRPYEIIGIGTELDRPGDGNVFRSAFDIGDGPYIVCVGRVDSHKGALDLYDYFTAYKQRNQRDVKLVFIGADTGILESGESGESGDASKDVLITGRINAEMVRNAVAGAVASIHPSYFESFSMTLIEAWAQHRPVLVNARCDVLDGQVRRSGGGLPYRGFAEFEAGLDMLLDEPDLQQLLGRNGRSYVEKRYTWDTVLDSYEAFLLLR